MDIYLIFMLRGRKRIKAMELDRGRSASEETFDLKCFLCAAIWESLEPSALQITKKHLCQGDLCKALGILACVQS